MSGSAKAFLKSLHTGEIPAPRISTNTNNWRVFAEEVRERGYEVRSGSSGIQVRCLQTRNYFIWNFEEEDPQDVMEQIELLTRTHTGFNRQWHAAFG